MEGISEEIFQNLPPLPAPTRASGNLYWGRGCLIKLIRILPLAEGRTCGFRIK